MSRTPSTPVEVRVGRRWYRGTLRSCEVSGAGTTCTGIVTFMASYGIQTGRFPASHMRTVAGEPGCPADHDDQTCGGSGTFVTCGQLGRH